MMYPPLPLTFGDGLDNMRMVWLALSAVCTIGYFFMNGDEPSRRRTLVKIGAVGGLALWAVMARGQVPFDSQPIGILIFMALFFSVIGDGFLAQKNERMFLSGLVAFLAGHVAFVVAMLMLTDFATLQAWQYGVAAALALGAMSMMAVLWKGAGSMRWPVVAYTTIIAFMGISAIFSNAYGGWVIVGAVLFMISDSMIGVERFRQPFVGSRFLIWATYMGAQYLLTFGLVNTLFMAAP